MHPMLNIAIRAARTAGNFITKHYEIPDVARINQKDNNNFITNVDREAERLIIEMIRKYYPDHSFISEGSGELIKKDTNVQWIIDPLDGTDNFIRRFPHFAISIAARIKGRTEVAVIYDPMRNELFTASRGQGAQLNSYRLRGGNSRNLDSAILATSFPFRQKQYADSYVTMVNKLFIRCADFRCTGSVALDLAYVAAGRLDGFFEIGLKLCDFVGGELLVCEAGGLVTDFAGGHTYPLSGNIVAGNPRIIKSLLLNLRT